MPEDAVIVISVGLMVGLILVSIGILTRIVFRAKNKDGRLEDERFDTLEEKIEVLNGRLNDIQDVMITIDEKLSRNRKEVP